MNDLSKHPGIKAGTELTVGVAADGFYSGKAKGIGLLD